MWTPEIGVRCWGVEVLAVRYPWQPSHGGLPLWGQLPGTPAGMAHQGMFNTLRPRQNGRHFADDIFKRIFLNENARISIKISLKFVPKGPINNIPALVQIMAWHRTGDKPLSEPMMGSLLTHICVTRPQWVNSLAPGKFEWSFRYVIFKRILVIDDWDISRKIAIIECHWTSLMIR